MGKMAWVLAVLAFSGCALPFEIGSGEVYKIYGLWHLEPAPERYPALLEAARACLLPEVVAQRSFGGVSFWGSGWIEQTAPVRRLIRGMYRENRRQIIVAAIWLEDDRIVQHEMLHYLIPWAEHETPVFERCDPLAGTSRR